ncbi:unnamed protein product [Rhizoctonia solani]|uniref:Uncharacterized protein n=1 Tax=Rhizoctonia solani TaxID=456999 RepID=A0A8H3BYM5_9AGAM|nr:unnamed protein product [Rhizoctonia solani]
MCKAFTSIFNPSGQNSRTSAFDNDDANLNAEVSELSTDEDPDKLEHNCNVVQGVTREALAFMAEVCNIHLSASDLACARQIVPKVSGLVRRVNDSPTLENAFLEFIDKDPKLKGDMRSLERYVAARCNTILAMFDSYIHFKNVVKWLTDHPRSKLRRWALNDTQWEILEQLKLVLQIFKEPTDRMSQAGVPLVSEVVPDLLTVQARLYDVRDDTLHQGLDPTIRVAAQASLLAPNKYMKFAIEESDVCTIAIVMCPDRKLKWFADRNFEMDSLCSGVALRFEELYPVGSRQDSRSPVQQEHRSTGNIFTQRHSYSSVPPVPANADTIQAYLDAPVVPPEVLAEHGGVIGYWNNELSRRPRLARMSLDYLTAPAPNVRKNVPGAHGCWFVVWDSIAA